MVCLVVLSNKMEAVCVTSGTDMLNILEQKNFNLILMDIFLGEDDGRLIAKKLKDDNRFQNIPIILYSAGQIHSSSIAASKADAFIQKPFDIIDLVNTMKQLMTA